jgi:pimeloyl-ACP methyl ester carboxylesterase
MRGRSFSAPVDGGQLSGTIAGSGPPVLLLHGGPGLSYDYVEDVADDIGAGFEIASYQQRGIAPSMLDGPFDVPTHIADVGGVLDALGWQKAYVVGHSWGGHLAFHLAVAMPERLLGALSIDPLGAVGDGGVEKFNAEMMARCPEAVRVEVEALEAAEEAGEPVEPGAALALYWPAYFASWDAAPPMPPMVSHREAFQQGFESLTELRSDLEAALPSITVPFGIVAGARSPMPAHEAAELSAAAIPGGWAEVVDGAGHFPWVERPGCVRSALDRLAAG